MKKHTEALKEVFLLLNENKIEEAKKVTEDAILDRTTDDGEKPYDHLVTLNETVGVEEAMVIAFGIRPHRTPIIKKMISDMVEAIAKREIPRTSITLDQIESSDTTLREKLFITLCVTHQANRRKSMDDTALNAADMISSVTERLSQITGGKIKAIDVALRPGETVQELTNRVLEELKSRREDLAKVISETDSKENPENKESN